MSYYTSVKRPVFEDTPRDPANGICSLRGMDIDWEAIEAENACHKRELEEKQKTYPADFFNAAMPANFNAELKKSEKKPALKLPREPIACALCGATFVPKSKRQRFCGILCRQRDYWARMRDAHPERLKRTPKPAQPRACLTCGKTFIPTKSLRRYCSDECRRAASRKNYEENTCPLCGKLFTPTHHRQRYCSAACSQASQREDNRQRSKAWRADSLKVYHNVCRSCGKEWTSNRRSHACSARCRSKIWYQQHKQPTTQEGQE